MPPKLRSKPSVDGGNSKAVAPAAGSTAVVAGGALAVFEGAAAAPGLAGLPLAGPFPFFANEAALTGVIGVEGVGVAGGSPSDAGGPLAVEFFFIGR